MPELRRITVPDLGTDDKVDVVEVLVAPGDRIEKDAGLITLESDKASMDVPAPTAGSVVEIAVKVGDQIGEGDLILTMQADAEAVDAAPEEVPIADQPASAPTATATAGPPSVAPVAATLTPTTPAPTTGAVPEVPAVRAAAAAPPPGPRLLVIGAGPGGYTAAFRAADLGLEVTLVERYPTLGGVCLNVGCIPSKALLHVARVIEEARALGEHGVDFGEPRIDLDRLRAWKGMVVDHLTSGLSGLAKRRQVDVIEGAAHFTGRNEVEIVTIDGTRTLSFDQAVIAVGSRPIEIPGILYDDPRVMDSTDALALAEVPERLLLVGGGIVGLEMAMVYGALGSKLTVVELLDGLIPGCDRDLVKPLHTRLEKELGAEVRLETKVSKIEPHDDALLAFFEEDQSSKTDPMTAPETAAFDRVLVAVGRRPNGDRINVEAAGVAVDERGFIAVDRQMRTNVPHIYAIGDVAGDPMLAHKATHEGKVAAEVAAGEKSSFDARVIPSVAYTDPEIAWVGLTEIDAKAAGIKYKKANFPWAASGRSLGMGRSDGKTKILFDPETDRVLGAGIVGPHAGDLIAELALAIEMDATAGDLALTIHPHPTLSETVAFAAEAYEGTITDLYLPKRR